MAAESHPYSESTQSESASARPAPDRAPDVVVIGAGVCGLGIAWRLRQRGLAVTMLDKGAVGAAASWVAGGMLAACAEAEPGEEELVRLGRHAQAMWPAFAAELEAATGVAVGLRSEGTLVVAPTADERARLLHHHAFQKSLGLTLDWLPPSEVRRREPHLAASLAGAMFSPEDHQVETRSLVTALARVAAAVGVDLRPHTAVARIVVDNGRATGVELADGSRIAAGTVVLAAGAWSRGIEGLPPAARPPVRPIKGQVIALTMDPAAPLLRHVLWAPGCYLVPRNDGQLILGATVEEKGFDTAITAGGIFSLLEAAWRVLPAIEELPIVDTVVGHRPGSRDDAPILGVSEVPGLVYATGHHRNGILLAPVTADAIARLVAGEGTDPAIAAFGMERFAAKAAA
ncbi:glycine oxidase ThiO [Rhodoplanes sp. TEM]|uniref:Glycine oxidase ThiO n=1 Tax=Rhodoplanes tepidamans TaxID=200616 RepID=A0ABT5JK19_RHOTP|nr:MULTISPECIES: glycine oxidase ThiO [Rhodoplanes]MDC7789833.1 glycine oxidase ThiO [Rhodoplanes tepidamans]MDC7987578.1 glycine oxidase ThiO [Rhodoplanes sp. TEM]MDQ0359219.1 glycine oxidase [Rhodoplanes tepidamans]